MISRLIYQIKKLFRTDTFISRLEKEYDQLFQKTISLNNFIHQENEIFDKLSKEHKHLLYIQFKHMSIYKRTLNERIQLIKGVSSKDIPTEDFPKVTETAIDIKIKQVQYKRITERLTHCTLTLENGYEVTGESSCVSVENYNQAKGEEIAFLNARDKIWQLEGYLLKQKIYEESK